MLHQLLATYVGAEQVRDLYQAGEEARFLASECYRRRKAAVDALASQIASGCWHSPAVAAAVRTAQRDHYLLWFRPAEFVAANKGGFDLDIEYHPLTSGLSAAVQEDQFTYALSFLDHAQPAGGAAEPWLEALNLEAQAYLRQLWGDWHLERATAKLAALEEAVLNTVAGQDAYTPTTIQAHAILLQMYRLLGLPWRVEAAYRRFCAGFDPGQPGPLCQEGAAANDLDAQTRESLRQILTAAVDALKLRNPSDTAELERLQALQQTSFPPRMLQADRPAVELPPLPAEELIRADEALARLADLLPDRAGRARWVLRTWQAAARQGSFRFREAAAALHEVEPDDEALGIVVCGLRGEARYRLASYEDACLDLRRAERSARMILERAAPEPQDWSRAARDFLSRLAQKAGNALLALGDEGAAQQAYDRAQEWLPDDPLARASDAINRGNLAYLRHNLANERGYVTLDGTLRQRMAVEGPQALQAEKMSRHVASLTRAERAYREALDALSSLASPNGLAAELAVAAHVNLGNTAWAWAGAMEAERVPRLDGLPLGEGWESSLVRPDFGCADCYQAAIEQQQLALAALPPAASSDPSQEATAWSNLSELYYLLGEQSGSRAHLEAGVAAAERALQRTDTVASALHPELVWRTHYNLARLSEALGQPAEAQANYRQAIQAIEALRAGLRLDAWQATFLHDKLEVYEGYIHFLYHLNAGENLADIFELVEKTKARAFLDLLEAARVDAGLDQDLVDRRDDLLAQVTACNEGIRRAVLVDDQGRATALLEEQRHLALQWNDLQSEIAAAQQADQDLNPRLASLGEVQQSLGADAVLWTFLLGLRHSYLLVVEESRARVFELPDRRTVELAALPAIYYCSRSSKETCARFRAASVGLAQHLLGWLDTQVDLKAGPAPKRVLIAPDGILCYLPFEALLVDGSHLALGDEVVAYADLKPCYLLSLADVSYVPSASAWLRLATRPLEASQASLLAAYNIRYNLADEQMPLWAADILLHLPDVPGAQAVERVAAAVHEAWPNQQIVAVRARQDDGQPEKPERQPTEKNLLDLVKASPPRFFLFNGHGVYNDKVPSLSGLVLNLEPIEGGEASSIPKAEDGFLRVEELFRLALPGTELSFLAACQTALGTVYRGEGLNALTRAFMYRGSPAVIASLWAVDSEATSRLLRWFFTRVAAQPGADRAHLLAEAKRQVMAFGKDWCLPYFWAPFILCGAGTLRRHEPVVSVSEND